MMTNPLKRGEVWLADLNPTQGSEHTYQDRHSCKGQKGE